MNSQITAFSPNWVSPPGDTINAMLDSKGISLDSFARLLNKDVDYLNDLIQGIIDIDEDMALQLSNHLGSSKEFWVNRSITYRKRLSQLESDWLTNLPIKDKTKETSNMELKDYQKKFIEEISSPQFYQLAKGAGKYESLSREMKDAALSARILNKELRKMQSLKAYSLALVLACFICFSAEILSILIILIAIFK